MTLSDDQIGDLLREVPLPHEPFDRYAAVAGRRRARDRRRQATLGAALAVVLVAGTVSVVALRPDRAPETVATLLANRADTARLSGTVYEAGKPVGSLSGTIDFSRGTMQYVLTAKEAGKDLTVEFRLIGDDMYVRYPSGAFPYAAAGKPWLHLANSGADEGLAQLQPGRLLDALREADAKVDRVGEAKVNGTPATRYHVVVPESDEKVTLFAGDELDLYVDGSGQVLRITSSEESEAFDLEFTDFGAPVTITAPPADQVAEQTDLAEAFATDGSGSSGDQSGKAAFCQRFRENLGALAPDQRAEAEQQIARICQKG